MFVVEVRNNQEVIARLEEAIAENGIKNGAIASFFGAFDSCCISNMPIDNAQQDVLVEYDIPLEVSGCGDVVDGKVHIHVTASSVKDQIIAGHLHWARVKTWFVKAYIIPGAE